jgi:hypothetical protein
VQFVGQLHGSEVALVHAMARTIVEEMRSCHCSASTSGCRIVAGEGGFRIRHDTSVPVLAPAPGGTERLPVAVNGHTSRYGAAEMGFAMFMHEVTARVVRFFRAGYAAGAPLRGYASLLAMLPRRLSDDEVAAIAAQLPVRGTASVDGIDIGVAITRITNKLPAPDDVERVTHQRRSP